MDLIYANKQKEDLGVLNDYEFDMAYGASENNFTIEIISSQHCCQSGYFIYAENTDYGGVIDEISVDTDKSVITYSGRTWHGLLDSHVIVPDSGNDYLIVSGDANAVIANLITRLGINSLFSASTQVSSINIQNYKIDRYISAYKGICKMLKKNGAKLIISWKNGKINLEAKAIHNYANDDEFDQDLIDFEITKNYTPINHVICLGTGELADRTVIHLYADAQGNISRNQSLFGNDEVCEVYDYPNAESESELEKGGREIIEDSLSSDEIKIDFNGNDNSFDVGDIIGATEQITGISVKQRITKKIIKIKNYQTTISYQIGE